MPWQIGFINIERPGRGVTVSAMGINGAQLSQWSKWRPGMWEDLAQTKADLIILAYGTNEAFSGNLDISSTERTWRNYIRQIKKHPAQRRHPDPRRSGIFETAYGSCGNRPVLLSEVQQMQQRVARDEKNHVLVLARCNGRRMQHEKTGWRKAWRPKTAFTFLHKAMKL